MNVFKNLMGFALYKLKFLKTGKKLMIALKLLTRLTWTWMLIKHPLYSILALLINV